jgi:predicted helicase
MASHHQMHGRAKCRGAVQTEGLRPEFEGFLPIASQEGKSVQTGVESPILFRLYSGGVKTNRDAWAYNFDREALSTNMAGFIDTYNSELDRWRRAGIDPSQVDDFVLYDDRRIKWSGDLKGHLI